jgi:hypothetical protein
MFDISHLNVDENRFEFKLHLFLWEWSYPEIILLIEIILRTLSFFNILLIFGFTIYSFIANIHTDRLINSGCAPP